ncbi:hypothetical protein [Rhodococcus sp. USK13]|uniref:hypothetical protein n=1 Tax=Rhodococcus sp. USK13 TaxID=2806442 RepID=UPI001BCD649F|nr:hypothetical protein [Rhodococcus sp. USK13]
MNPDHKAMVDLAMRWLPFGGPPAGDILVTFGLSSTEFYRRILNFVGNPAAPSVPRSLQVLALEQTSTRVRESVA